MDGYEEGNWKILSGDFREEGKFIGGLKQGIWKGTFKNGQTSFEGEFINGDPEGKHIYYFENGNAIFKTEWEKMLADLPKD